MNHQDFLGQVKSNLEGMNTFNLKASFYNSFCQYKEIIESYEEPRNFWDLFHDTHAQKLGYYGYLEHAEIQNKIEDVLLEKMELPKHKLIDYILNVFN